jgi:hypothetical protein
MMGAAVLGDPTVGGKPCLECSPFLQSEEVAGGFAEICFCLSSFVR